MPKPGKNKKPRFNEVRKKFHLSKSSYIHETYRHSNSMSARQTKCPKQEQNRRSISYIIIALKKCHPQFFLRLRDGVNKPKRPRIEVKCIYSHFRVGKLPRTYLICPPPPQMYWSTSLAPNASSLEIINKPLTEINIYPSFFVSSTTVMQFQN